MNDVIYFIKVLVSMFLIIQWFSILLFLFCEWFMVDYYLNRREFFLWGLGFCLFLKYYNHNWLQRKYYLCVATVIYGLLFLIFFQIAMLPLDLLYYILMGEPHVFE
ncbi:hypothetical protein LC087_10845 [Bacillus carboniphilus]|uniref:Uncharacterized protein n=1 Tax=Bacillus carboniphilus TaxID=86663 RepID=A0ABY9JUR9_9BACI|nr:hypothetical protein [Bacillus carboniphilus]WLR41405.1 hypothetical protein LC087_10845 [Bacillus carboniphilus]